MSLLSSDIFKFINFLSNSVDKIKNIYKKELELIEWNVKVDDENLCIIKNQIKDVYKNDNDFFNDISKLSVRDENDLYRTLLKIIDILDLNESKFDNAVSKIFLGSPCFNNCGEGN